MYLLLITQDLDHEIGFKYPNYCLDICTDLVLRTQVVTDLRLKKAMDLWMEKTGWDTRTKEWWNPQKGIRNLLITVKGVVRAYASGIDSDRWNDLYSAGMQGLAFALGNFNPEKGRLKDHVRRNVRNHVIGELRKIQRWNMELPMNQMEDVEIAGDENLPFEDTVSRTLWQEDEPLNPEEKLLFKEQLNLAEDLLEEILDNCNVREIYVIYHYIIADQPETLRDIADRFNCHHSSIYRDVQKLKKLMREKGEMN